MNKINSHNFTMRHHIWAAIIFVLLFLGFEHYAGALDYFSLAKDPKYNNLAQVGLAHSGDNFSWSYKNLEDSEGWTEVHWNNLENYFRNGTFWFRIPIPANSIIDLQDPLIFALGGNFSADIYWDGRFIGRKGNNLDEAINKTPYYYQLLIQPELLDNVSHTLAIKFWDARESYFIDSPLQILSLNSSHISNLNILIYNFFIGTFFLILLSALLIFAIAYFKKSGNQSKNLILLIFIGFILADFLSWILSDITVANTDTYIAARSLILLATFLTVTFLLADVKGITAFQGVGASFLTGIIFLGSLFFKKDFFLIFLTLQFLVFLYFLYWVFLLKWSKVLISGFYILILIIFPLLAFYKPYFMSTFGVYYFSSAFFMGPVFQRGKLIFNPSFLKEPFKPKFLDIYAKGQKTLIPVNEIQFISAVGHYTEIKLKNNDAYIYQHGISKVLERLPNNFIRIHRSHAINVDYANKIHSATGSKYFVSLKTGQQLPVGRKYIKAFRKILV